MTEQTDKRGKGHRFLLADAEIKIDRLLEATENLFTIMSKEYYAEIELPLEVALALSQLREAANI